MHVLMWAAIFSIIVMGDSRRVFEYLQRTLCYSTILKNRSILHFSVHVFTAETLKFLQKHLLFWHGLVNTVLKATVIKLVPWKWLKNVMSTSVHRVSIQLNCCSWNWLACLPCNNWIVKLQTLPQFTNPACIFVMCRFSTNHSSLYGPHDIGETRL